MGRIDFFMYLSFYTGVTDTDMGWFSGLTTVPTVGAVPAVGAGAAEPAVGGWGNRSIGHLVFAPFPLRALNQVEQGSVGVGQTPARCGDLCLPGVPRVVAHFLRIFY